MGLAERAGTLQSEMLHTLNIDDEDEPYKYGLLFLIGLDKNGIYVGSCVDVSAALGVTACGMLAAEKLTGVRNDAVRDITVAATFLDLRSRFIHGSGNPGPYLVKTSSPLSRDDLENYLRALDSPALKSFLQRSKI